MPVNLLEDEMPQAQTPKAPVNLLADEIPEKQEKEEYSTSLKMAPFRVMKDLGDALLERMKSIPHYIEKGKSEIPGLFNAITEHPISTLQQEAAGLTELGHGLINTPSALVDYGVDRLHLLPEEWKKQIFRQRDISQDISKTFGEPTQPGQELLRGGARNLLSILPTGRAAEMLNPLRMTSKNIARDVLRQEQQNIEKYSGKNGKYNLLRDEALSRGITGEKIRPTINNINDLHTLYKEMPTDEFVAVKNAYGKSGNLVDAQNAISQLGFRERALMKKSKRGDILTQPEKDLLEATKNIKNDIQENMFKDNRGKIHEDLIKNHKQIQTGYRKEVIPYTKNKAIQEYKAGEKLADELAPSLMKGKFPAQAGKFHRPLMLRRALEKHPIIYGGLGLGSTAGVAALLYKALSGEDHRS